MRIRAVSLAMAILALPLSSCAHADDTTAAYSEDRLAEDPDLVIPRANEDLQVKTLAMQSTWWSDGEDWSVDLERGIIEFRNKRGWNITAPVQVVGTYNTLDGTFMWGWDHPSVPEQSASAAQLVHDYGERHDLEVLTTRIVELSEDEAWELTALATYLFEGTGAYRGPAGTTMVFMTFGTVTIAKP